MSQRLLEAYVTWRTWQVQLWNRMVQDESGEGVISVAIAVLVIAFLGAAMWVAFNAIFTNAANKTGEQVNKIGS